MNLKLSIRSTEQNQQRKTAEEKRKPAAAGKKKKKALPSQRPNKYLANKPLNLNPVAIGICAPLCKKIFKHKGTLRQPVTQRKMRSYNLGKNQYIHMNFGGNEVVYNYSESGIIILPVPYDETSTWMKGADKGPDAILDASVNLEFYDIETSSEAHLKGIYTLPPVLEKETPEKLAEAVYYRILNHCLTENKFPVIIGGNHTVSIGAIKAFSEIF